MQNTTIAPSGLYSAAAREIQPNLQVFGISDSKLKPGTHVALGFWARDEETEPKSWINWPANRAQDLVPRTWYPVPSPIPPPPSQIKPVSTLTQDPCNAQGTCTTSSRAEASGALPRAPQRSATPCSACLGAARTPHHELPTAGEVPKHTLTRTCQCTSLFLQQKELPSHHPTGRNCTSHLRY